MLLLKLKEKLSKIGYALSDNAQEMLNKIKISGKNKFGKKVAGLVLASALAVAPIGLAACSANCNPLGNIQNTNPDNTTNPESNTPSNPSGSGNQNDKIQLSSITYKLMTDENYANLARKVINGSSRLTKNMLPIPYQFLREEGKDVDAYINGTLNAFASSYMYDNDKNHLYVSVKAENKSYSEYGNYYTNYVLKYPLTNQESEEFLYLCKNGYLQGLLFIQELDIQKNPEVLSEVNIAKTSYEKMVNCVIAGENINPNKYNSVEVDFLNSDMEKINVSIRGSILLNYSKTTLRNLTISDFTFWVNPQTYDNNVLWYGSPTAGEISIDDYLSSTKNITSFGYSQDIVNAAPYSNDYPFFHNNINNK